MTEFNAHNSDLIEMSDAFEASQAKVCQVNIQDNVFGVLPRLSPDPHCVCTWAVFSILHQHKPQIE